MQPSRNRPHPVVTGVALVLAVVGLGFAALVSWVTSIFLMWENCPGYDDEGIVAAPKSMQGRVMCNDTGLVGQYYILAVMVALVIVALVVWLRRRAVAVALILAVAAVVVPVPMAMGMLALPDTCTSAQWDRYGDDGCQKDLEL